MKKTDAFMEFLDKWEAEAQELGDQHALNNLIKPTRNDGIEEIDGLKVRLLSVDKWNDYHMDGNDPYLLHYKSDLKKKFLYEPSKI